MRFLGCFVVSCCFLLFVLMCFPQQLKNNKKRTVYIFAVLCSRLAMEPFGAWKAFGADAGNEDSAGFLFTV